MATSQTPRAAVRDQLRAYIRAALFRLPLPGTEPPALVLPRRIGYQSHVPTRSFAHATVLALGARLPDRERSALLDLAECSVTEAARRRGWSPATVHKLREAGLDWLLELLYQQPDVLDRADNAASLSDISGASSDQR